MGASFVAEERPDRSARMTTRCVEGRSKPMTSGGREHETDTRRRTAHECYFGIPFRAQQKNDPRKGRCIKQRNNCMKISLRNHHRQPLFKLRKIAQLFVKIPITIQNNSCFFTGCLIIRRQNHFEKTIATHQNIHRFIRVQRRCLETDHFRRILVICHI